MLLLPLITVWAFVFYYAMLNEIYDSLDDGLENQKDILIGRLKTEPNIIEHRNVKKNNHVFTPINKKKHKHFKENFRDTLIYVQSEDELEAMRIYSSAIKHNNAYYKLDIITSMVEEDDLIESLITYLLGLYVILILSILILNNLLLKRLWKPFYHLIAQLQTFKIEDNTPITLPKSNIEEFKLLNTAVNTLLQKSTHSYSAQKQFIENAAHELQTPLAITINKLELFLENTPLNDKQLKDIGTALDNLGRLTRLNKSLLLLSKIENQQFVNVETIPFNTLTEKVIADFEDLANHKNMRLQIKASNDLNFKINQDLAVIMLTNLVKNALVHGKRNNTITITIQSHMWSIINYGTPHQLDQNLLFTRFKKTTTNTKSTGLGLSIAKAIATKYAIELNYDYNDAHIFKLTFPKK
ncbi:sensor histidine kinase [Bizionia saleffrena]